MPASKADTMKLSILITLSIMATTNGAETVQDARELGSWKGSHYGHHHGYPKPPPPIWGPPPKWGSSYYSHNDSSSSKSSKGSSNRSSKSSKSGRVKYVWVPAPKEVSHWGGYLPKLTPESSEDSSKSSKSYKSGKGSSKSSKSKSSKSKSSKGSSKSSKGSSSGDSETSTKEYHYYWVGTKWGTSWGPGLPTPPVKHEQPSSHSSSSKSSKGYGKSGKGSSKSGKGSGKSGKGSSKSGKGSKSTSSSADSPSATYHFYHYPAVDIYHGNGWGGDDQDDNGWGGDDMVDDGWGDDGVDDGWGGGEIEDDDGWAGDVAEDDDWGDDIGDDGWGDGVVVVTDIEDDGYEDDGALDDVSPVVEWADDGHDDDGGDLYPNSICFVDGEVVTCDGPPEGDGIHVEFTYSVDTSGIDPEDAVASVEHAILEAVADYVSSLDNSYYGVTRVSSLPEDYITDEAICTPKHSKSECSIVTGEMTVYADGHSLDACDYSNIVEASMELVDFSDIDGVKDVEYLDSGTSCSEAAIIVGEEAAVTTQQEGLSTGALIGLAMLGACLAAIALLAAKKLRRRKSESDDANRDFDLISVDTDFEGNKLGSDNPFTSTVDVHKCASIYCNCNKGGTGTTFLPAPKNANMDKVMKKQGIDKSSPTGVTEAQGFFVGDPEPLGHVSMDTEDSTLTNDSSQKNKDTIIRVSPNGEERPLTPVREVAHESEMDTELSDGEDDLDSIPPPPPLPPGAKPKNELVDGEMSV